MKVTVMLIAIGSLSTAIKGLIKGLQELEIRGLCNRQHYQDQLEYKKSPGDLKRLRQLNSSEKPSVHTGIKKYQMSKIIMIIIT